MASYTIEDIELIRRKSGISYQEAVALLDYHNGNVARALVDLERNGRIKTEANDRKAESAAKSGKAQSRGKGKIAAFFSNLYQFRLIVKKDNTTIANISLLFAILSAMMASWLVVVAALIILILGYKVSFNKKDPAFAGSNLDQMVRSAAENAKATVTDFARNFEDQNAEEPAAEESKETKTSSYYQSNPAATTYHTPYTGSAPTIQVPVQVETQEGSVSVQEDAEGFTNATIE